MKRYISNHIDNGKTNGSKSIRFFIVFLCSILFSFISLSVLYVVYNKTKGFVSFSFLSDAFLYLASNYLFGAFVFLSIIFAIFSINHVDNDKKSVGKHKYKLLILIATLIIYSLFHHIFSIKFVHVQDDIYIYYFMTYILSLLVMSLSTVVIFYLPFSTNFKEIFSVFKHERIMFFVFKVLFLICFFFALMLFYTDTSDFISAIFTLPLCFIFCAFLMFLVRTTSEIGYANELMKLKFELNGFDISGIETKYQSRLNEYLYFLDVENIYDQLSTHEFKGKLIKIEEVFKKYLKENEAYHHMFIFIKNEHSEFIIVDLDGKRITSS